MNSLGFANVVTPFSLLLSGVALAVVVFIIETMRLWNKETKEDLTKGLLRKAQRVLLSDMCDLDKFEALKGIALNKM